MCPPDPPHTLTWVQRPGGFADFPPCRSSHMVALGMPGGSSFSEGFPTWAWGLAKLGLSFPEGSPLGSPPGRGACLNRGSSSSEGFLPLYVALFFVTFKRQQQSKTRAQPPQTAAALVTPYGAGLFGDRDMPRTSPRPWPGGREASGNPDMTFRNIEGFEHSGRNLQKARIPCD